MDIVKGNIGNALHDISPNHVVATADEIYDEGMDKRQNEVNVALNDAIDAETARAKGVEKDLKNKTSEISKTAAEGEDDLIMIKSDNDTSFAEVGTKNGKSGIFASPIYDIEGEDEKSLQEKVDDVQTEVDKKADADDVNAAIRTALDKVSDISKEESHDESEKIVLATDSGKEVTSVSISTNSDGTEGFDLATDDGKVVTSVEVKKGSDDNEVVEFGNDSGSEVYAKVGSVDGKKGIFTANLYDLQGNPFNAFTIDTVNDVIAIAGKKYKMIEYVE